MAQSTKTNYKKTLNLPKTSFAMRAALTQSEPKSLTRWEQMCLYDKVLAGERGSRHPNRRRVFGRR